MYPPSAQGGQVPPSSQKPGLVERMKLFYRASALNRALVWLSCAVALLAVGLGVGYGFWYFHVAGDNGLPNDLLPHRRYSLMPYEQKRPQNLNEALDRLYPEAEDFLHNPKLGDELLAVKNLDEIINSRLSINSLRDLGKQFDKLSEETPDTAGGVIDGSKIEEDIPKPADGSPQLTEEQKARYAALGKKVDELLKLPAPDLSKRDPLLNVKVLRIDEERVELQIIPECTWLAPGGYTVYRQVDGGQTTEVAKGLAQLREPSEAGFEHEDKKALEELFRQADYDAQKQAVLGLSPADFQDKMYRGLPGEPKIVKGKQDFKNSEKLTYQIPDGVKQKLPDADIQEESGVLRSHQPKNTPREASTRRLDNMRATTTEGSKISEGVYRYMEEVQDPKKAELAEAVINARNTVIYKAVTDRNFAKSTGFLLEDKLGAGERRSGNITYIVTDGDKLVAKVEMPKKKLADLQQPTGVMGYGADGQVKLRWDAPPEEDEKLITGYIVEKRKPGEEDFKPIGDAPVVVSNSVDETEIHFESPVFVEDAAKNGEKLEYRVCSIDRFGRRSPYSETLDVLVEKVSPPEAPALAFSLFSGDAKQLMKRTDDTAKALRLALEINRYKKGNLIPIVAATMAENTPGADLVRFIVYRAEKVGSGSFGEPEPYAGIEYDPKLHKVDSKGNLIPLLKPEAIDLDLYDTRRLLWGKSLILDKARAEVPDVVFFDADIEEGVTYKYWVSAFDSWNNESSWSKSVTCAVPSKKKPDKPEKPDIEMLGAPLKDRSQLPPGVVVDGDLTKELTESFPNLPLLKRDYDTKVVSMAQNAGIRMNIYEPTMRSEAPAAISSQYFNNTPTEKMAHRFFAVRGEDVYADGSFRLRWPAYVGSGLGGYHVYQALFEAKDLEGLQEATAAELLARGDWLRLDKEIVKEPTFLVQKLARDKGKIHLFLITLSPAEAREGEKKEAEKPEEVKAPEAAKAAVKGTGDGMADYYKQGLYYNSGFLDNLYKQKTPEPGGFVSLKWEKSEDPQVGTYRVYRAEVKSFKKKYDSDDLEWTLVADNLQLPRYTDRTDQDHAHYYYYKITTVSVWGVESGSYSYDRIRVPSMKPPQTPAMRVSLSKKGGVQVNFSQVPYCSYYEIYRTPVPRINIAALKNVDKTLLTELFIGQNEKDKFYSGEALTAIDELAKLPDVNKEAEKSQGFGKPANTSYYYLGNYPVNMLTRLRTPSIGDLTEARKKLDSVPEEKRIDMLKEILNIYGPLALADYADLSYDSLKEIRWEKIGEVPVDEDTEEKVHGQTGLVEPLNFLDKNAEYGTTYLYSVQAWNDDNLGSTRPEPVEGSPRRSEPFEPLTGLAGEHKTDHVSLRWDLPKYKDFDEDRVLRDTVGYIVYRGGSKQGPFRQASPLLFSPNWEDDLSDSYGDYWYSVRVVDNGGYLSDFCPAIHVPPPKKERELPPPKKPWPIEKEDLPRRISGEAPEIDRFHNEVFRFTPNQLKDIPFVLSRGTEPITYSLLVQRLDENGKPAGDGLPGFSVDTRRRLILLPASLEGGSYSLRLEARNFIGRDTAIALLVVSTGQPPKLEDRKDNYEITFREGAEDFRFQFAATGTPPLSWSISDIRPDPNGTTSDHLRINNQGMLTVSRYLKPGDYSLRLTVKNDYGEDSRTVKLHYLLPRVARRQPGDERPDNGTDTYAVRLGYKKGPQLFNFMPYYYPGIVGRDFKPNFERPKRMTWPEIFIEQPKTYINSPKLSLNGTRLADIDLMPYDLQPVEGERCASLAGTATFIIEDLKGEAKSPGGSGGSSGKPELRFKVHLYDAVFEQVPDSNDKRMIGGQIYIDDGQEIKLAGGAITISSFYIDVGTGESKVSGVVRAKQGHLAGSLSGLSFKDCKLIDAYQIELPAGKLPKLAYERMYLYEYNTAQINLRGGENEPIFRFALSKGKLQSHLETLNNEGFALKSDLHCGFDSLGRFHGTLTNDAEDKHAQFLQLIVPGGAGLQVEQAELRYVAGKVADGYLRGRMLLPFEKSSYNGEIIPGTYVMYREKDNELDYLRGSENPDKKISGEELTTLAYNLKKQAQRPGLLVLPNDLDLHQYCAGVSFSIGNWDGEGFGFDASSMEPFRVAERTLDGKLQRSQALIISPKDIHVDLNRKKAYTSEANKSLVEANEDFWVGMRFGGGSFELPADFVKAKGGQPILFQLEKDQLFYDLNGFSYQNYLISPNPDGVEAEFGSALGSFKDVRVKNLLLDLYRNEINMELDASVGLDLFNHKRVDVKLYTNKEDNADGKKGQFLCSVVPTKLEKAIGDNSDLLITGGFVKHHGLYVGGELSLKDEDYRPSGPLGFSELIIPADRKATRQEAEDGTRIGYARLEKPVKADFQGFEVLVRELQFYHQSATDTDKPDEETTEVHLGSSILVSEDIPLTDTATDRIRFDYTNRGIGEGKPAVLNYEGSYAMLDNEFEGAVHSRSKLIPRKLKPGEKSQAGGYRTGAFTAQIPPLLKNEGEKKADEKGLIEFNAEEMELCFLGKLDFLPIHVASRFGYDTDKKRTYYILAIYPDQTIKELNFAAGKLKDYSGIVAYNFKVRENERGQYIFPDNYEEAKSFIRTLEVNREGKTTFAAGFRGTLSLTGLCEIRELYIGIGRGPKLVAGGNLYVPLDIGAIVGGDAYRQVGTVDISYYHPRRHFSFSMTLQDINVLGAQVGGSLGFEMAPDLFGLYIGYPETLYGNIGIYRIGLGVAFRHDEQGDSFIKCKAEFGYQKQVEIAIVYLGGYVYAGVDGEYHYGKQHYIGLTLYVKGGLYGGIKAFGKRYDIIRFALDARLKLQSTPNHRWRTSGSVKVSYYLKVFFVKFSGSVRVGFNTTI